jgi:histone deacetylase 1/2
MVSPNDMLLTISWCHTIYFLLYVDDIVITGSDDRLLQSFIDALSRGFDIKDLGNLHYFLGLQVASQIKGVHISQPNIRMIFS